MPEYFSVEIEFDKTAETGSLVRDLFDCLAKEGVSFLRGDRKSEGFSIEQQITVNQNYINDNGDDRDGSYYQTQFRFLGFSEVRGYWDVDRDSISFALIIPEFDFYEELENYERKRHEEKMNAVKELCVHLWKMLSVVSIQTAWECSDVPPMYAELSAKYPPQTEPFSIVPSAKYHPQWGMTEQPIERDGVLLEEEENWLWI